MFEPGDARRKVQRTGNPFVKIASVFDKFDKIVLFVTAGNDLHTG